MSDLIPVSDPDFADFRTELHRLRRLHRGAMAVEAAAKTAPVAEIPPIGDRGCDCLNDCGDDERVRSGQLTLCSWGAKYSRLDALRRAVPARAQALVRALHGAALPPCARDALLALQEALDA